MPPDLAMGISLAFREVFAQMLMSPQLTGLVVLGLIAVAPQASSHVPASVRGKLQQVRQQRSQSPLEMLDELDKSARSAGPPVELDGQEAPQEPRTQDDPAAAAWDASDGDFALRARWRDQVFLETSDKLFQVHLGGRFGFDMVWHTAEDQVENGAGGLGPLSDGAGFRRARLRADGTMYEIVSWLAEYEFNNLRDDRGNFLGVGILDLWGQVSRLPLVGNVRLGHFREPFGYEALVSGNDLDLLERSTLQDAFVPFRNVGVMLFNTLLDERATWAVGWFRANSSNVNAADSGDGANAYTGRLTSCPWYGDDGRLALHLGVAGTVRETADDPSIGLGVVSFLARPEMRISTPVFVKTGPILSNRYEVLGAELAFVANRFTIQSEYMCTFVNNAVYPAVAGVPREGVWFQGVYVQAGFFLTDDCRPYNKTQARWSRVRPRENFICVARDEEKDCWGWDVAHGTGAWEVVARYSYLDLDNSGIDGGNLRDLTFGLNWYLNPNTKMQWNYILVFRDVPGSTSDGVAQIFGMRLAMDF